MENETLRKLFSELLLSFNLQSVDLFRNKRPKYGYIFFTGLQDFHPKINY